MNLTKLQRLFSSKEIQLLTWKKKSHCFYLLATVCKDLLQKPQVRTSCMLKSYIPSCIHYFTPLTFHAESPLLVLWGETTSCQVNKALSRIFPSVKLFIRSLFTWIWNELLELWKGRKIIKVGNQTNTQGIFMPTNNADHFHHRYYSIISLFFTRH